jgi:predicted ArsR family transcriptional regulator
MTALDGRRGQILSMIRESVLPLGIAEIADRLGVHPNTVRFHLDVLADADRVELVPAGAGAMSASAGARGRPAHRYRAVRQMDPNGRSNYRLLAAILTDHVAATSADAAATATELGRGWGPALIEGSAGGPRLAGIAKTAAVTHLVSLLDELGFEPEPNRGGRSRQLRLRHCPFLGLVQEHAEVICSLHLGLMQGALAAMGAPVTVARLDPFVEPDLCVAQLGPVHGPEPMNPSL